MEDVVSDAKLTGGKHFFAITVIGKRSRFANQRVNHMTIVDRRGLLAEQAIHRLNQVALISHVDLLGFDSNVYFLVDQTTGHRIGVGANADRAALANPDAKQQVRRIKPVIRESPQHRLFLCQAGLAISVAGRHDLFDEDHVLFSTGEVATAA
jgi:hypothetical protein